MRNAWFIAHAQFTPNTQEYIMDILYTVDSNFLPQLATGICSICKTCKNDDAINFHVIQSGVSKSEQERLASFCSSLHASIAFYPVGNLLREFDDVDTGGWSEIIMARLLMGRILPPTINRVLYLDGDTLVCASIDGIWNTDLQGNILGAVVEPTIDPRRKTALGLKPSDPYINSGVLLVDLASWRENNIESLILDYCEKNSAILFASDQDAINVVLKDRIRYLPPSCNFCNTFYLYPYRAIRKMTRRQDYYSEDEFERIIAQPVIIHFLGEDRPWREGSTHRFRDEFEYYLELTPYANMEKESGWLTYFKIWSVFNAVMKPFPMLRLTLINRLIPFVKKINKRRRLKSNG